MSEFQTNMLHITTGERISPTRTADGEPKLPQCPKLMKFYDRIVARKKLSWTTHLKFRKLLGTGGQGIVYLTERRGSDGFTLPVALKIFSPERYSSPEEYDEDMARIGAVGAGVARIQHDNLVVVHNFLDRQRVRMMVMEWVDGFDLRRLLTPKMFGVVRERVSEKRWEHINRVLVTAGPEQPRFKAGVAIAIVRDCLEALAALHREGIVHSDIKPANIMLKRSGHAKIIDIGSAFYFDSPPERRACTPAYAAIEVLEGEPSTHQSDLASLGYVTVELLAGRPVFSGVNDLNTLIKAKRSLVERLPDLLPEEVVCNDLLMTFLRGLVEPDPEDRFSSAEIAETHEDGAGAFHRQLIIGDLASEYENDIRIWIEELVEIDHIHDEETKFLD